MSRQFDSQSVTIFATLDSFCNCLRILYNIILGNRENPFQYVSVLYELAVSRILVSDWIHV